jgi:hypothetical protein
VHGHQTDHEPWGYKRHQAPSRLQQRRQSFPPTSSSRRQSEESFMLGMTNPITDPVEVYLLGIEDDIHPRTFH